MLSERIQKVLQRIEAENKLENVWIVGSETGQFLYDLVREMKPEVALEIGTSVGYSALWMAAALQVNGKGKLWTVESHAGRFERAQANIDDAGMTEWIAQVKGHMPEVLETEFEAIAWPPARIEFAFFDATKMEHESYFDALFPRMSKGGIIVVDNALSHRFGPMAKFIERLHKDVRLVVKEVPVGSGLLVARRV